MSVGLNAYLQFRDQAAEALKFYQSIFGGKLEISTLGDFELAEDPADTDKVMHGMLETDNGLELMAADTPTGMESAPMAGFSLALFGFLSDEAELRGYWEKLADGGEIAIPLELAPWGDYFGQLTDRFGVQWMFDFGDPRDSAEEA